MICHLVVHKKKKLHRPIHIGTVRWHPPGKPIVIFVILKSRVCHLKVRGVDAILPWTSICVNTNNMLRIWDVYIYIYIYLFFIYASPTSSTNSRPRFEYSEKIVFLLNMMCSSETPTTTVHFLCQIGFQFQASYDASDSLRLLGTQVAPGSASRHARGKAGIEDTQDQSWWIHIVGSTNH